MPGVYQLVVRAQGLNGAGQPVTHLVPITLAVGTGSSGDSYVDIEGFALFRVTAIDANNLSGYAISGLYASPEDPGLQRGQSARLMPWN